MKRDFSKKLRLQVFEEIDYDILEDDSDLACLKKRRHISITPITWDMTANTKYEV